MLSRFLSLIACFAATAALGYLTPLAAPDLAARDFRNGPDAVAAANVSVIGFGPAGEIYVAGAFNSVDGQPRAHGVARLSAEGTLDAAWNPALPYSTPPRLAGQSASGVVALVFRVAPADTLVHVPVAGPGSAVRSVSSPLWFQALAFDAADALYAAEGASSPNSGGAGVPADIYKFSAAGALDVAFRVHLDGDYNNCKFFNGPTPTVHTMVPLDGYLYLGGNFVGVTGPGGAAQVGGAARVSPTTGDVDPGWHPMPPTGRYGSSAEAIQPVAKLTCALQVQGIVNAIVPGPGQSLYLGGSYRAQGRNNLGRFSRAAPGTPDGWSPPQAPVTSHAALDPAAPYLYVAGPFIEAGGWNRNRLAAFSTVDGSASAVWDPNANSGVTAMAVTGDRVLVGGSFTTLAGISRVYLAGLPLASSPAVGAVIDFTPRIVDLGLVPVDTSVTADVVISNIGSTSLTIQNIDAGPPPPPQPGESSISQTNNCSAPLPPGGSCTVQFTVHAGRLARGWRSFPIVVSSDGSATPQTLQIAFTAAYSQARFNAGGLFRRAEFGPTPLGATRVVQGTLTNAGNYPMSIAGIGILPGGTAFAQTNACPASLAAGASCAIDLTFSPLAAGAQSADLRISFSSLTNVSTDAYLYATPILGYELRAFLDGTTAGPSDDSDGDGIPNSLETPLGLNPTVKDNDVFADTRLFAMQQYRDFLGREGDSQGVSFWSQQVSGGALSRGQLIESFFGSPEFQGAIAPVARLYFAYFLRIPDYDGLNFWIGYYRGGNSLEAISGQFAGSGEFVNRYGALDNGQFVDLVYQNVLGRAPDAAGRAFWKGELDSGTRTRGQVMLAFSESLEYRDLTAHEIYVTMAYIGMLRRAPDAGGFSFWVNYLDGGSPGLALIDGFLVSPEYRGRFLP